MKHRLAPILAAIVLISSCTSGNEQVAGIDRGGIVVGSITGFGSIAVNGTHYGTDSVSVTVNGKPGQVADLEVGHVVTMQAAFGSDGITPVANTIHFENIVAGAISDISISDNRLVVLGQPVHVDSATSYAAEIGPRGIESLSVNQTVKVSGFVRSDRSIQATRIDPADVGQLLEVIGFIENLDDTQKNFNIGNLVIDYSSLTLTKLLEEGDRIKVTGTQLGAAGELLANEISARQRVFETEDGDEAEVEGLITNFFSPTQFMVEGISVSTDGETEFDGGSVSSLADDVRVEVEGRFDSNGILVAKQVEFRKSGDLRLSAPIESIDDVRNELVTLGVRVEVNDLTSFEDKSLFEIKNFGLPDLHPGEYIKLKGYESSVTPDVLVASSLERTESETTVTARGFAENVVPPTLSILGVAVATDSNTEYESADDLPIDAAEFFATADGQLIEVTGSLVGGIILAEEIEFED